MRGIWCGEELFKLIFPSKTIKNSIENVNEMSRSVESFLSLSVCDVTPYPCWPTKKFLVLFDMTTPMANPTS